MRDWENKMRKKFSVILLLALLIISTQGTMVAASASAAGTEETTTDLISAPVSAQSDYACLMDADTGVVLYDKGMDTASPPASVTKVMTTYLALEHGNLSDKVTMTQTGVNLAVGGLSNLYTQVGEEFTLEQLLYGTMIKSANDMATQVGEYIGGGSLDNFIQMMNEESAAMGCTNTHFANACGYPDDNNYTTCHDMSIIFRNALKNEEFRKIIGTKSYTIPATNMTEERSFSSHVALLMDTEYTYDGIIGGKTGYTDGAWNTLVVGAERNGMTLVATMFHAQGAGVCASDAVNLLDYGFNNFEKIEFEDPDFPGYKGTATVPKGVTVSDLTRTDNEITSGDATLMELDYSYNDSKVGSITMTKDEYDAALAKDEESQTESMTESSSGGKSAFKVFSGGDGSTASTAILPKNFSEFGTWIKSGPHLILFALFIIVVIALIFAIAIGVFNAIKTRQRKKRRK